MSFEFQSSQLAIFTLFLMSQKIIRGLQGFQAYKQSLKDVQNYLIENQVRWSQELGNVGLLIEIQQLLKVQMSLIVNDSQEEFIIYQGFQNRAIKSQFQGSSELGNRLLKVGITLAAYKDAKQVDRSQVRWSQQLGDVFI
ncbi:unnamed protein product [Paramecium primaurelia]|uniref:Uncharacterized protein n=1 Tax=Paramecium primaurelia TaxID=5886 RepID=A0A8S1QXE1_PARPR|nr:unnamed protein product [Paramecium primaurelia]